MFNRFFDWLSNSYGSIVGGLARKATRSMLLLVAVVAGIWLLGKFVPGGFIPDEDKGYLFVAVELPEGASLQRTDEILKQVEDIVGNTARRALGRRPRRLQHPQLAELSQRGDDVRGPGTLGGAQDARAARQRPRRASGTKKFAAIPGARAFAFGPPPLPGYGNVSGFTMQLQDRSGGSIEQLAGYVKQLTEAVAKRPEIGRVSTTFNPATPQVKVELDREKARTLGVPVDSIFQTLQTYLSGLYVNDFVRFGRVYKVFLQAEPEFTSKPDDIGQFYVRNNERRDGAAEHAGEDQQDVRPELRHPLQPLQRRRNHGRARARLQFRAGDQGHRGSHENHAQRSRLRMVRPDAPGKEIRGPGADHLRHGGPVRLPAAGGAVRKLGAALRGAAGHADRHPGHDGRHVGARTST